MREAVQERCSGCTKPNRDPASVLIRESGSRTMTDNFKTSMNMESEMIPPARCLSALVGRYTMGDVVRQFLVGYDWQ